MKVAGVITEYNPFHNGHKYQLSEIRRITNADYIIVAMSGNFVQRGTAAIMDKYVRAQMALSNGADLILELPAIWATASAEVFANGGVTLLASTGIVDYLCFGAETDDLSTLQSYASRLNSESSTFRQALEAHLKKGLSYPSARIKAHGIEPDEVLSSPNNILAMEYLKALDSLQLNIEPVLIPRIGDNYTDSTVSSKLASATALRKLLTREDTSLLHELTPCSDTILEYSRLHGLVLENDISDMLFYKLLCEKGQGFTSYADCSDTISNRIIKMLPDYTDYTQFCDLVKSKDITHSRIRRVLCHILLNIYTADYARLKQYSNMPYLRVLGFRKDAAPLLNNIKKEASSPLITKVADASSYISSNDQWIWNKDLFASNLHNGLIKGKHKTPVPNDFKHQIIIL